MLDFYCENIYIAIVIELVKTGRKNMKDDNKRFTEWRNRAIDKLPEISARVFSLRKQFYNGCGFHYSLEHQLGNCIARLNNFDDSEIYHAKDAWSKQSTLKMIFTDLFERVKKIEVELKDKNNKIVSRNL